MSKKVGIVGLGYVGLPLAVLAARSGYDVIGIDNDEAKATKINQSLTPFYDEDLAEQLKAHPVHASTDDKAMKGAKTIVICVPTPVDDNRMPDLNIVINTVLAIASILEKGQLIIVESTINPGVCDDVIIPLIEANSSLKCNTDFFVAHCPERVNPGDPEWNVSNIPRVLGASNKHGLDLAYNFYTTILNARVKKMETIKEAEAVKVVENSFRDVNIAFVNELAMSFDMLGIDVVNVIDGAATKPFSFMAHYPGIGVGGHCIPVDPYYLIEYAKDNGFTHKFLTVAREINNDMPAYVINTLQALLKVKKLPHKKVKALVLGLSYKPNVGDLRESPSLEVIDLLREAHIDIVASDPYVEEFKGIEIQPAATKKELLGLLGRVDVVIVATSHKQYLGLTAADFEKSGVKIVIDGRNCLDKKAFERSNVLYRGIGR